MVVLLIFLAVSELVQTLSPLVHMSYCPKSWTQEIINSPLSSEVNCCFKYSDAVSSTTDQLFMKCIHLFLCLKRIGGNDEILEKNSEGKRKAEFLAVNRDLF